MQTARAAVVGAGIGGLVAALDLAIQGVDVVVVERADGPGGKVREIDVGGARIDAGPTVFTMRSVFEELFSDAGTSLTERLTLRPADVLSRHAWSERERLDLFAEIDRSVDAIGAFAGPADAAGYRAFCAIAARTYDILERPFIVSSRPSLPEFMRRVAARRLADLWRINPYQTLWSALGDYFRDPRLRQLFGRYATYCGSSPFRSPATLMLVAHVERRGVWLVEGGMARIAEALTALGRERGVRFRYGCEATEILFADGRVSGVTLAGGERVDAEAVVVNADAAALATGLFGRTAARAVPPVPAAKRSLSAMTWALVAETRGFPLSRHNVFFSKDSAAEFDDLFRHGRLPADPTIYVCAQDRSGNGEESSGGPERLLCIANAPPNGDSHPFDPTEIASCEERIFRSLERFGLGVRRRPETTRATSPAEFNRLFPATGGAIYGQASHGWRASFSRPGSRTRAPGLYLAGGSTHPGPGLPMAAISGRLAAASLLTDLASTRKFRRGAIFGGTPMRSATTDATGSR